jgi:hypothetical protein
LVTLDALLRNSSGHVCVVGTYRVFFAWWLDNVLARQAEKRLRNRVSHGLAFLFTEHGARFVPNDAVYRGGKVVTLEVDGLLVRAAHDRGEDFLDIAPRQAPNEWEQIGLALMAVEAGQPVASKGDLLKYPSFLTLLEVEPLLKSRFAELKRAYSPGQYSTTKRTLEAIYSDLKHAQVGMLVRKVDASSRRAGPMG